MPTTNLWTTVLSIANIRSFIHSIDSQWRELLLEIHFGYSHTQAQQYKMSFCTQLILYYSVSECAWWLFCFLCTTTTAATATVIYANIYRIMRMSKHCVWDILCIFWMLYDGRNKTTYRLWRLVRVWSTEANNQMCWWAWPHYIFALFD